MVNKMTALLIPALLVLSLALSACGSGDKQDQPTATPVVINGITLSQTIRNPASGISLRYPAEWVAKQDEYSIVVANNEDVLMTTLPQQGDMVLTVMALELKTLNSTTLDAAVASVAVILAGNPQTTRAAEPVALTVGGKEARRMDIVDVNQGDTVLLAWIEGAYLVVTMGITPRGGMAEVEPYTLAMAETITYRK